MPPTIELTIVAARRPSLLARTLDSFHQHLFRHFNFSRALINIDPVWGDQKRSDECVELLNKNFPDPTVFTPESAGFTAAVKRVWSATKADFIFHLEDDWLLNEDITPAILDHSTILRSRRSRWCRRKKIGIATAAAISITSNADPFCLVQSNLPFPKKFRLSQPRPPSRAAILRAAGPA